MISCLFLIRFLTCCKFAFAFCFLLYFLMTLFFENWFNSFFNFFPFCLSSSGCDRNFPIFSLLSLFQFCSFPLFPAKVGSNFSFPILFLSTFSLLDFFIKK